MTCNLIWLTNVIVDGWLGLMTDCWRRFGSPRHTHTHTLSQVSWWADCCSLNSDSAHCHVERRGSPLTCVSAPLCTEHSGAPGLFFFSLFGFICFFFFVFLFLRCRQFPCRPAVPTTWTELKGRGGVAKRQGASVLTPPWADRQAWPAGGPPGGFPSQLCLYYIVLTCRSLCVSHTPSPPPLERRGENPVGVSIDICTNAPLWERKWNLDISVVCGCPCLYWIQSLNTPFLLALYQLLLNKSRFPIIMCFPLKWTGNSSLWWPVF